MIKWIKPAYDELTTYIITITCILLLVNHPELRIIYGEALSTVNGKTLGWIIAVSGLALVGASLSIYHVFVRRPKDTWEKTVMASLAMGANGTAGIASGMEILPKEWTIWAVLPIWNITASAILLYQIGLVPEDAISDTDASQLQIAVATGTLFIIFLICEQYLNLSWAMSFSVSVTYASFAGHVFKIKQIR